MVSKKTITILIGIVLVAFGIGFLALNLKGYEISKNKGHGFSINLNPTASTTNVDEKAVENIDGVKKIYISTPIAKVNIIPENREDVYVHYHGYISHNIKTKLNTGKVKDTLEIKAENKNYTKIGFSNLKETEIYLDVYVPTNYSKDIDIEANLGDINISDFNLNELDIDADLGNIKAKNINAMELDIDADLGNVNLENINVKNIEIECDSGNIVAKSIKGNAKVKANLGNIELGYSDFDYNLNAVSNLGSITITLPKNASFNLDAKSDLGTIKTDFPVTTTEASNTKLKGTVGNGGKDVKLTVDLGSIKIKSK
ncbi:MAG: DUF4097 domain-containing protein [Tissierellia bacterium]|nr:DUF4097 domain-containing protein [Tissierellia bacterium]